MKILYLITKSELGGAQTHVFQLAKYFQGSGNQVIIMSNAGGWLEQMANENNIEFCYNKYFSNDLNPLVLFKSIREVSSLVDKFDPDIIHCHSSIAGLIGRLVKKNKTNAIFTVHGWSFESAKGIKKLLFVQIERFLATRTKKIICVSKFSKDIGLQNKICSPDKMEVVYNGIEVSDMVEIPETHDQKVKIIFVGRMAPQKDPIFLLDVFNSLEENLKNRCELILVGDGPDLEKVKSFVFDKNITQAKILGGIPRDDVLSILQTADIFVLSSNIEAFPYTIIEAMQAGLPVIASDVGGVREAVTNDVGFLIAKDKEDFMVKLQKLIEDKEMRRMMGGNGRRRALTMFSIEKMLSQIKRIYENALGEKV